MIDKDKIIKIGAMALTGYALYKLLTSDKKITVKNIIPETVENVIEVPATVIEVVSDTVESLTKELKSIVGFQVKGSKEAKKYFGILGKIRKLKPVKKGQGKRALKKKAKKWK